MNKHSTITTNHTKIKRWVEERGGWPAHAIGTGSKNDPGMLRIHFPNNPDEKLEEISWEAFFKKFDEQNLAFAYQEEKANGEMSYFNKLVSNEKVNA